MMNELFELIHSGGLQGVRLLFDATLLAVVTWLACATLLRRSRPVLQGALWTIVLIKFFIPPILPGDLALSGLVERSASRFLGEQSGGRNGAEKAVPERIGAPRESMPAATRQRPAWKVWLLVIYFSGLCVVFLLMVARWARTRRWLATLPEAGTALQEEVRQLSRRLALRGSPRVVVTEASVSPFVFGVIRPALLVPVHLLDHFPAPTREALLIHELAHLRRGDPLVRVLQVGARTFFFFWPPVWWVCRRIEKFAELACDQWAVAESGVEPDAYASSLLAVIRRIRGGPALPSHLNFARQGSLLEERFRMILNQDRKVSPRLSLTMACALAIWIVFAWGGGLAGATQEPSDTSGEKPQHKRVRIVRIPAGGAPEALMEKLLLRIPEADLDGNGVLSQQELHEYFIQQGAAGEGHYFFQAEIPPGEMAIDASSGSGSRTTQPPATGNYFWIASEPEGDSAQDAGAEPRTDSGLPGGSEGRNVIFIQHRAEDPENELFDVTMELPDTSEGPEDLTTTLLEEPSPPGPAGLPRFGHDHLLLPAGSDDARKEFSWTSEDGTVFKVMLVGDSQEWDSDGDGDITLEEVQEHLKHPGLAPPADSTEDARPGGGGRLESFLNRHPGADLNGDGEITREEAEALARKIQSQQQKP